MVVAGGWGGAGPLASAELFDPGVLQNFSDSWWNAAESGWGITLVDHDTNIFVQWYTFDQSGHNEKYVIAGGTLSADKCRFGGTLQHVTGPSWTLPTFDPAQVVRTVAGSANIDFCPDGLAARTIVFDYTPPPTGGQPALRRSVVASRYASCARTRVRPSLSRH